MDLEIANSIEMPSTASASSPWGSGPSMLRQRKNAANTDASPPAASSFADLDFYPKVEEAHVIQTETGGLSTTLQLAKRFVLTDHSNPFVCVLFDVLPRSIVRAVTLVSAILIFILICAEFTTYLTSNIHTEMALDAGKSSKIHISLNITFHALSCQQAKMDVMDVAGSQVLDMAHLEIHKQRLDASGRSLGRATVVTTKTVEPPFMQMLRAFLPGLVQDVCARVDVRRLDFIVLCYFS